MRVAFLLTSILFCGCATDVYECQPGSDHDWLRLDGPPANLDEVLSSASQHERQTIDESETVRWYAAKDGSVLACIPGESHGACGSSFKQRQFGCGQTTYAFQKIDIGWSKAEVLDVVCTCDPAVRR